MMLRECKYSIANKISAAKNLATSSLNFLLRRNK